MPGLKRTIVAVAVAAAVVLAACGDDDDSTEATTGATSAVDGTRRRDGAGRVDITDRDELG